MPVLHGKHAHVLPCIKRVWVTTSSFSSGFMQGLFFSYIVLRREKCGPPGLPVRIAPTLFTHHSNDVSLLDLPP